MKWVGNGSLHSSGYGAPELKRCYQPYMSGSLVMSILFQVLCIASFYAFRQPEVEGEAPRIATIVDIVRLPIPPRLTVPISTSTNPVTPRNTKYLRNTIPVPVMDPLVDSVAMFPTQQERAGMIGTPDGSHESWNGTYVAAVEGNSESVPPRDFEAVEIAPRIVKRVSPRYPAAALRAGISGTVFLRMWVNKMGRVHKAEVTRGGNPLFDSAAVQAATQWIYTPAIMNHKPVSVWVTVPFGFRIEERRP